MKSNSIKLLGAIAIIAMVATTAPVFAKPDTNRVIATNNKSGRTVTIPQHAKQVADHVFFLGTATDPATGQLVEGVMIINDRQSQAKGGNKGKPDKPGNGGGEDTCYAFLGGGAHWKTTEGYTIDTDNQDNLSPSFVISTITTAIAAWNSEVSTDIFGPETIGQVDGADELQPDGINEVLFADIDSQGAVGVTIVWGIFKGKPDQRQLVEWDQVYDDTDFDFGDADINPSVMDLQNVAVHEVGHAAGLGHPSDNCVDESMYRFVSIGETLKRDLNTGDIAGIVDLYL